MDPRLTRMIQIGDREDAVAVEEPLEIRVDGRPVAVTMRTPGNDEELALGFLFGEGLIGSAHAVDLPTDLAANTIEVSGPLLREVGDRNFYASSSCGVCGKGAIEQITVEMPDPPDSDRPRVQRGLLASLPQRLAQPAFELTGGTHATGLFSPDGDLLCAREDVGRHNAMDKVVGWALAEAQGADAGDADAGGTDRSLAGRLLPDQILCVSGRLSFELVQKAALAGSPILLGVGAPSSLAIDLATERGMTLCGFVRDGGLNVYSAGQRVEG